MNKDSHHKDKGISLHLDCSDYLKGKVDLLAKLDGVTKTEEVRKLVEMAINYREQKIMDKHKGVKENDRS